MTNSSQPQDPAQPDTAVSSNLTSSTADPVTKIQGDPAQTSTSANQTATAVVDPDRIALPPGQELPRAQVSKSSQFLGMRRGLDGLQVLLVLALAFLSASFAIRNSDFFLHLATGRAFAQGAYEFGKDPFSYTTQGLYWVNHSWLYDWGLFHLYNWAGSVGLVIIKALLVTLLAALMIQIRRKGQSLWIPALCTALAVLALSSRLNLHPALISTLFLGVTLYLLTCRHQDDSEVSEEGIIQTEGRAGQRFSVRYIALIVLVALWANLDDWFILGPITIGLFLLGEVIQGLLTPVQAGSKSPQATERRWLAIAFVGSLAGCLLNPHHVNVFSLPLEVSASVPAEIKKNFGPIFQSPWMREYWKAPEAGQNVAGLAYFPMVLLGLLSFLANSSNFRWWRLLVWGAFLLGTALRARLIPFFAVVSGPIMVLNFQDFLVSSWPTIEKTLLGRVGWQVGCRVLSLLLLIGLALAAWPGLLQAAPHEHRHVAWAMDSDQSLERAAVDLAHWRKQGVIGEGDHGFSVSLEFANYCAWFCPEEKGFVDYRIQLFPASIWEEFFKLRSTIKTASSQGQGQLVGESAFSNQADSDFRTQTFAQRAINHVVYVTEKSTANIDVPALLTMAYDQSQWTLLAIKGRTALFGWRNPRTAEKPNPFADHVYNPNRDAFGPQSAAHTIPQQPIPPTQRADDWYEFLTDYMRPARPTRSADEEEANLDLVLGQVENNKAATRIMTVYQSGRLAEAIGYGFGAPAPTCLLTFLKRWELLLERYSPTAIEVQAASPLLAIRAARRAIADNPDNSAAYVDLAKSYLSLPEGSRCRDVNDKGYLVASLRRCQAVTALRAAITLKPDNLEAHLLLHQYFSTEPFTYQSGQRGQKPQGPAFQDLALQHLSRALEIMRAGKKKGLEEDRNYQELEKREKELESLVRDAKNKWLMETSNSNKSLLEKAIQAGYKGLAGEALKTLEGGSVPELTSSDNSRDILDRDLDGIRIELDMKLRCGQTDDVYTALYTNDSQLLEQSRLKDLGQVRLPCYRWIGVQYAASVGDFAQADSFLKEMIQEVRQRNKQELDAYNSLFVGNQNNPQIEIKSLPWMLLSMAPVPKPLCLVVWQNLIKDGSLRTFQRVSPLAHEEADLNVLRGLLALETGDTKTALEHLEYAHDLATPPELYLRQLGTLGITRPLCLVATAAALNQVRNGYVFAFPTQDFCNLYLRQLQEQDR
ncbi:MAG: hypothetical protein ACJ8FY_10275 [Gemmataceae bacterium]